MTLKIISTLLIGLALVSCKQESDNELSNQHNNNHSTCHFSNVCSQALPALGAPKGFSSIFKKALTKLGNPLHRGRDQIVIQGQPIWIHAKFSYGIADADLKEEPVDIYLSQGCSSPLKKIGQAQTSVDGQHGTIDGVEDTGGRIYAKLSDFGIQSLPIGRHRIVLVVPGDNTTAELNINVIAPSDSIVVSDIDGTLTTSELAAVGDLIGVTPNVNPGAPAAMTALYNKGYQIVYLTARAEWFMDKTREWLRSNKFPPGTIRTTQSKIGFSGDKAAAYKLGELQMIKSSTGKVPTYGFGNKASDVKTYGAIGIPVKNSYYFKMKDDAKGGTIHSDYNALAAKFSQIESVCK